jgi:hypothetical protein
MTVKADPSPQSPRPEQRPRIYVRVDHDCSPDQWRIDCAGCGDVIVRCVASNDVGRLAAHATARHVCEPLETRASCVTS